MNHPKNLIFLKPQKWVSEQILTPYLIQSPSDHPEKYSGIYFDSSIMLDSFCCMLVCHWTAVSSEFLKTAKWKKIPMADAQNPVLIC